MEKIIICGYSRSKSWQSHRDNGPSTHPWPYNVDNQSMDVSLHWNLRPNLGYGWYMLIEIFLLVCTHHLNKTVFFAFLQAWWKVCFIWSKPADSVLDTTHLAVVCNELNKYGKIPPHSGTSFVSSVIEMSLLC